MSRIQGFEVKGVFNDTENKEIYLSSTYEKKLSNWQLICATIGRLVKKRR